MLGSSLRALPGLLRFAGIGAFAAAFLSAAPPEDTGDRLALFREIVAEHAKIRTIDAEITQIIKTGDGPREIFRGRYRADSLGRFRIDYRAPSAQVVVNDGTRFYWYYSSDRLLYEIEKRDTMPARGGSVNPLGEFGEGFESRFEVRREGKRIFGLFDGSERFTVKDGKTGAMMEIRADAKRKLILEKTVRDGRGREIMKESYAGYARAGGAWFPSRVTVSALTARGVTVNITDYIRVSLNGDIPPSIFILVVPRNAERRKLNQ